jgi:DNA topoisomerase VI subunit B
MTASTAALTRTTFETSRLLEFFTEKELTMQIGHARERWPIALLKELIDNALDACEAASIPPVVDVEVTADAFRVGDNGPGLPAATLTRSLDYAVRVSDKAFYVSPTRGQLGNALKCVYAAPFVVHGETGRVDVATAEQTATITIQLDRLEQRPVLDLAVGPGHVKTGTEITVHWPEVASFIRSTPAAGFYIAADEVTAAADLVRRYAVFNPHATLRYRGSRQHWTIGSSAPAWRKWQPNDPTSPHWYTPERLRALLAAYITADRAAGRGRTVREVVAEFAGLSGTAKQKAVTDAAGMTGARLEDLVVNRALGLERLAPLLRAMQQHSRPIRPAALGLLGTKHLQQQLVAHWDVTPESFRYGRELGTTPTGVPWLVETALGFCKTNQRRQILCGVNCSPLVDADTFHFVVTKLGAHRIDPHDPVVFVIHVANPRVRFSDRGKSVLALEDEEDAA